MLLSELAKRISPESTILFLGAGASIPSGAPSVKDLSAVMHAELSKDASSLNLSEITRLVETKLGRPHLIKVLREKFSKIKPARGMLNIPLYKWAGIYSTNYDTLLESAYEERGLSAQAICSSFDYSKQLDKPPVATIYKIHGCINKDEVDGYSNHRIIITTNDYKNYRDYQEQIYRLLDAQLDANDLLIIGHSLADPHIKELILKSQEYKEKYKSPRKSYLLIFNRDDDLATLYEDDGLQVAFGGLDDFFAELAKSGCEIKSSFNSNSLLHKDIVPSTIHVNALNLELSHDVNRMFHGAPATFADVEQGYTFRRDAFDRIMNTLNTNRSPERAQIATIIGASGVGKTTLSAQLAVGLAKDNWQVFWHDPDMPFYFKPWLDTALDCERQKIKTVLFLDDVHVHLFEVNRLVDSLDLAKMSYFKIVAVSNQGNWNHRVKSPAFFKFGQVFRIANLSDTEIDSLLHLIDHNTAISRLAMSAFQGFDPVQRRKRLKDRARADMFVCLKNIIASDDLDVIILREFADLDEDLQEVYRIVAALETAGIKVHRQLIVRSCGLEAASVQGIILRLADVISEYDVDSGQGIFAWRGRHPVISALISKYKYNDNEEFQALLEKVIDSLNPVYQIERYSIRNLCHDHNGIPRIPSISKQNDLLRRMISKMPAERVPRHALIKNLLNNNQLPQAETEIRLFESEFNEDSPVLRYKVYLDINRATKTPGIMLEDKLYWIGRAEQNARRGARKFESNKFALRLLCDVGIAKYKLTKDLALFREGIEVLQAAERSLGDPDIGQLVHHYQQRVGSVVADEIEIVDLED
ncbi:MAG: SIR2 family protein [Caulobacterales bacterium]|uniref:SIR2 family NAD-dependent protein deacylase n=1 Tax=Glycocaulis sp. TaxID=1969725 RepID=UPI003F9EC8B8